MKNYWTSRDSKSHTGKGVVYFAQVAYQNQQSEVYGL